MKISDMALCTKSGEKNAKSSGEPWWKGASIYQIYPRSFRDTNGDGIGDLPGVLEAIPYIASLNVDVIWISPFFTSPMRDFGYDIADYCDVDPCFGALKDFDAIISAAHAHNLKVIIDQVYSHTSSDHPWFIESRQDQANAKADWYVWADPKPDGSPPSNWQSVFGGPAWHWDARRKQYYLHNFLPSQPDLNVHNPKVQSAILDVARFWLDRGVDGFRLDAINFAMHNRNFTDNPPSGAPMELVTRPFDMQRHLHNQSQPEIVTFIERLQSLISSYGDRFTVAEVGGPDPLDEMKAFTAGDKRLSSAYGFEFLYAPDIDPAMVQDTMAQWPDDGDTGWPSWAFSNHDAPRALTRWSSGRETPVHAKLYLMLLLGLRGNPIIYQGEELGLPQAKLAFTDLKDPEAIDNWPHTLGRDGARTPFPWNSSAPNGGFTTAMPWLPMDPRHLDLSKEAQESSPNSVLAFFRHAQSVRQHSPILRHGALIPIPGPPGILAFERNLDGRRIMCAFNLTDAPVDWRPNVEAGTTVLLSSGCEQTVGGGLPNTLIGNSGYWTNEF